MSEENKETSFSAFNEYLRKSREGFSTEKKDEIETEEVIIEKKSEPEPVEEDEVLEETVNVSEVEESEISEEEDSDIIEINNKESEVHESEGDFTAQYVPDAEEESNDGESESEENEKVDISDLLEVQDSDEEDTSENQYFDPLEEQLIYSSNDDEVNFNDLNNSSDDEEEEETKEENNSSSKKMKFDQLNGSKGKYMAGKSRKTLILSVLVGVFAFLLLCLEIKKIASDKEAELAARRKDNTINTSDYTPDFGDYASRAHIQTTQESNQSEANYAEGLLTTNDRKNYEQPKPAGNTTNNSPSYQPQSSAPVSSSWNDAMRSSIRYSGFGGGNGGKEAFGQIGNRVGLGSNASYSPYDMGMNVDPVASYMDSYNQILGTVSQAAGLNNSSANKDTKRNFNNGAYDKNAQSGISAIPENSLYPGTIIHAVMVSGINTDYPGAITARVLNNVYDSKTGKKLLIPSGSILRGSYSSASIGVSRVQIAWTELILNRDGKDYLVNLGSMAGVDRKGYSGIKGTINDHYFAYIRAMGVSSLFTVMNQNIYKYSNAQKSASKRELIAENQDLVNKLTDKLLDRALDIEPTIIVRPGAMISVDVDKVLTLVPYSIDVPKQKYIRK